MHLRYAGDYCASTASSAGAHFMVKSIAICWHVCRAFVVPTMTVAKLSASTAELGAFVPPLHAETL